MPSSNKNSEIQYKSAPQGAVNLDEAQGIVECFVAGIGNKDSVGDVCAPGAFGKSLIRRKPRVVWGHNWNDPIGKVLDMYEVPPSDPRLPGKMKAAGIGGLYARVQFNLKSEKGREAFANVAFFGEEQEWSIGYKTINAKFDPQMQANILYEVELYEVSPVLHGANQLTGTISIKSEEQPSNVLVNEQKPVDGLNVNELSSVLDALKTIVSATDEKCGPSMPMGTPTGMPMGGPGMPSGGPGMPSAPQPMQSPAPRNVVKPEVPSMPENPMLVAIRRELVNRTGSNIIVRSAAENIVVFDRITSDGISSTYKLPFHYANNEFMFGKPEKINMQATPESEVPEMPGMPHMHGAYEATPAFEAGKSLLSFDDSSWGNGFNQQIPTPQVDVSTLNNVINNLEKIIDESSTYIIPVDVENAFAVKQAIDPILDYYRVDATVTEDGIVVKSLDAEFLDAMDVATKGVLRSIGNMVDRAVDRPNIGDGRRNRRDMNPNLASRGRGIGSRGAVVRLSDGTMWDPKNAPDRNNNGIVGEGLFDGRGMSLSQPDPTPDGPNSINGPKTPKAPNAPKAPGRLSSSENNAPNLPKMTQAEIDAALDSRPNRIDGGGSSKNPMVAGRRVTRNEDIVRPKKRNIQRTEQTVERLSSGEWTRNADGEEMDAPDIEGVYDVVEGLDGKFYVTRYSDFNRNGGQNAQEYEHDKPFSTLAAAKKWVEKDYAQAAEEYMPDGMEDAYSEDDERFSSGAIKKIEEINLPEMPADEPDDVLIDQYEEYHSALYDFVDQIEAIAKESLGEDRYLKFFDGSVPLIEETSRKGGNDSEQIGWALFHASNLAEQYKKSVINEIRLDADEEDRFSSGKIDFDKIGASGLKEMRHVERNPFRFDTQADRDARDAYEKLVANFRKNNGFFKEVPMYAGDKKWHSEDWFRGREMAINVATLRFEEPSMFGTMQLFDKPGKPSKKEFFERTSSVDYRNWFMHKVPGMTNEIDRVMASDLYSDEYKEAYLDATRRFIYTNRPDMQYTPREQQDQFYAWMEQAGLGWKGRYDTAGPKLDEMTRLSSGGKKNTSARSYENPEDLKEDMFMNLIAGGDRQRINDMTAEDLAYEINGDAEKIEPYLDEVKKNVLDAMDDYDRYWESMPDPTDEELEEEYQYWLKQQEEKIAADFARSQTVADKFANMTDEEAADYAAWLDEETWKDRDDRFSSGESSKLTPAERFAKYEKERAARNAMFEQMTEEELKDYVEYQQEENYDPRLSSGGTGPRSVITGERFIGRDNAGHYWYAYDREDDFENIDDDIVDALFKPMFTWGEQRKIPTKDYFSGPTMVRHNGETGANARRIAEAVANNVSGKPSLINPNGTREDILHFNYNGKERSVFPETFSTSKKGEAYFVAWDPTADDGKGAYRSFNVEKIEGLVSHAISPESESVSSYAKSWKTSDFSSEDNLKILQRMKNTSEFQDLMDAQAVIDGYVAKGDRRISGSKMDLDEIEAQRAFQEARNIQIDSMVENGDITPLEGANRLSSGKSKARGNRGDGKGRGTPWSAEDRQRFADGDILRSKKRQGKRREGPSVREFSSGQSRRGEFDFTPEELAQAEKARKYADQYGDWENLPKNKKNGYLEKFDGDENLAREQFNIERDLADFAADAQFDKTDSRLSSGNRLAPNLRSTPKDWEMPEIGDDGEIKSGPLKGYYVRGFGNDYVQGRKYVGYRGADYSSTDEHKNNLVDWGDYEPGYTLDRNIGSDEDIRGIADSSEQEEMAQYGDEGIYTGNSSRGRYDPQNDYDVSVLDDNHSPENGKDHVGKAVSVTDEDGNKFYGVVVRGWEPEYEEDLDVDEEGYATAGMSIQDGGMTILATHDADGKKLDKPVVIEANFGYESETARVSNVDAGGTYEGPMVNVSKGRVSEETLDEAQKLYEELDPYRNGKADEFRAQGIFLHREWDAPGGERERREKAAKEAYKRSPEGMQEQRRKLEASVSTAEDRLEYAKSVRESLRERLNEASESGNNVLVSNIEESLRSRDSIINMYELHLDEAKAELDAFDNQGSKLSSGRFAPDGESNSRLQRRLSSGDVKGPPPTGSGEYDRKKEVEGVMRTFHSDPGTAIIPEEMEGILGPVPKGRDSHVLNTAVAQKIIANPDMEYSADNGWPVDAGKLLDFIEVNQEDAIKTLREIGDAEKIAKILGIKQAEAQDMLDGKPVYIASSTAADMFDSLYRAGHYPDSVRGFNDVAKVWGFDGAPKWVRHSDLATPEYDLDENGMVNWSKEKWDTLSRADFDAEVRRGKNPPEPVYESPVERFNSEAIAANPKWDARAGSFRNPTVDAEFAAVRKPLTRAEQLDPSRYKSQKRVGETTAASDKVFLESWTEGKHGITALMLLEMLGVERQSDSEKISDQEIISLIEAINDSRVKAGLPALKSTLPLNNDTKAGFRGQPIKDEILNALIVSGRFKNMREMVAPLGDSRLDSLAAEYDSRMWMDAAVIRINNRMNELGLANAESKLKSAITEAFGRKPTVEKRMKEGRVSIKGQMTQDAMFGDEKVSQLLESVNALLQSEGFEPIDKDELFPKDEAGGFIDNLSAVAPGTQRMSSGQRFVARTTSSRRAEAMDDAAARRASDRPRLSSGSIQSMPPLRDENGRINPTNMRDAAVSATIPEGLWIRKTPGQNVEDFEKAVKTRAAIAEALNIDTESIPSFTVYDIIDELKKAGISEQEAEDLVDKLVELDFYIGDIEEKFSEARDVMDAAIEEAEDSLDKIAKLRKERADVIKRYGEEDGQPLLEAIDEKISKAAKTLDDSYQRGIGNEDARMGTLFSQVDEILSNNRGWRKHSPSPYRNGVNGKLAALEASIAKAGGTKKAVPVTGIDFGVPEGTRLSSGKADEYFQNLTSHLINMIEKSQKDGGKWEAPWHKAGSLPRNASTKNMYSGGNLFALMLAAEEKGFTTPHWGGFQQWKKLGGSVKKGEKATVILMPKQIFGEEIDPDTGKKIRKSKGVYFTTAHVFNLDQVEGIDRDEFLKMPTDALTPEQRVTKLEDAIKEVGATIMTGDGSRAYYSPREDHVVMPPFELFKTPEGYYGTLAHELVHWTGHSSRLDRKNMNQFGSPDYAREELVAEFGSAFLLAMFGLSAEPREDHAHYLANWLQVLRDEPNALQEASIKAQAASKLLIDKMKAVLEEMGEATADAESAADVKSLQIFNDPLYGVKDALIDWAKDPLHAPFLVKSLEDRRNSSGLVNRSWERIAETAIFLERLSRKK